MKIDKLFDNLINEVTQDYSNLTVDEIYTKGLKDPNFDFEKGLDALIEKDKDGEYTYLAGLDWKTFDFNKGLDALIKTDKTGDWIFRAGRDWNTFDFDDGLDGLIAKNKKGQWIYKAGLDWSNFDYKKGMKALEEKDDYWIKIADKNWPKTYTEKLKEVKDKYDENHIPGKRKKLKR